MNQKKYKVAVLMSTFNGEKYIKEQLNSLIMQESVDIKIYIRDDGSTDRTLKIINEYINLYPDKIQLKIGENIGFANSFYYLIRRNYIADFYAFSDQDDVWETNKLINAIKYLETEEPILYASNLKLFDMLENRTGYLYNTDININEQISNYFYILNPYGCTMVWNKLFQEILLKHSKPEKMTHDTWLNIIAHCQGKIYVDKNSYINYRIHDNNACGYTPQNFFNKLKKYYKRYFIDNKKLMIQYTCVYIREFFSNYADKNIYVLARYDDNFKTYIFSLIYILFKAKIPSKKKIFLLMLMRKL